MTALKLLCLSSLRMELSLSYQALWHLLMTNLGGQSQVRHRLFVYLYSSILSNYLYLSIYTF